LDFAPTTFFDGQGIMVRVDSGADDIADLAGASICVTSGTTTEKNLEDAMRAAAVEYTPVVQETADTLMSTYDQGRCDAVTADRSALVSRQPTLPTRRPTRSQRHALQNRSGRRYCRATRSGATSSRGLASSGRRAGITSRTSTSP
jgi:ABC-type amino acid transport substrate-binding protein